MKQLLSIVFVLAALGCSAPPAPKGDLLYRCATDRTIAIRREWAHYESISGERVTIPDWRTHSRRWARVECDAGRLVAAFHPVDTATARRHY